jgi:hypothetical protein
VGGIKMSSLGLFGAIGSFAVIEAVLRMLTYIAAIFVCFKAVKALDVYINKNQK